MKKLLALALLWNFALSGISVYLYSTQPEPVNRNSTTTIQRIGQDGYTPIKGVDYRDGRTLPAIAPQQPKEPNKPIDGINGLNGLSAYEIAVKNGFIGSEEEWLYSLKSEAPEFEPSIVCNILTGKFEWRTSPSTVYRIIPNSKCVV